MPLRWKPPAEGKPRLLCVLPHIYDTSMEKWVRVVSHKQRLKLFDCIGQAEPCNKPSYFYAHRYEECAVDAAMARAPPRCAAARSGTNRPDGV